MRGCGGAAVPAFDVAWTCSRRPFRSERPGSIRNGVTPSRTSQTPSRDIRPMRWEPDCGPSSLGMCFGDPQTLEDSCNRRCTSSDYVSASSSTSTGEVGCRRGRLPHGTREAWRSPGSPAAKCCCIHFEFRLSADPGAFAQRGDRDLVAQGRLHELPSFQLRFGLDPWHAIEAPDAGPKACADRSPCARKRVSALSRLGPCRAGSIRGWRPRRHCGRTAAPSTISSLG